MLIACENPVEDWTAKLEKAKDNQRGKEKEKKENTAEPRGK